MNTDSSNTRWSSAVTISLPSNSDFKLIEGIKLHPSEEKFRYGNCATIAICQAFDIHFHAFIAICRLMKIKTDEYDNDKIGLSFFECKRLINLLSDSCRCSTKYISNISKVSYIQMLSLLNKDTYLTMFDIHLSYAKNGEVYDSYFYDLPQDFKESKPTGWWKINI